MSKYQPLSDRLSGHQADEWRASFGDVEKVLGFPLPKLARSSQAWWSNDADRGPGRAWTKAGWMVAEIDRPAGTVLFRRNAASPDIEAAGGIASSPADPLQLAPQAERLRKAAPFIAGGVAVLAGVGALVARMLLRSKASERA